LAVDDKQNVVAGVDGPLDSDLFAGFFFEDGQGIVVWVRRGRGGWRDATDDGDL
jgi:hypothetical protein